jgi:hypothetical protein
MTTSILQSDYRRISFWIPILLCLGINSAILADIAINSPAYLHDYRLNTNPTPCITCTWAETPFCTAVTLDPRVLAMFRICSALLAAILRRRPAPKGQEALA